MSLQTRMIIAGLALAIMIFIAEFSILRSYLPLQTNIIVCVLTALALLGSGIRIVKAGHRAILIVLERTYDKSEDEFTEGPAWVLPGVSRLVARSVLPVEKTYQESIETRSGLIANLKFSFKWSISEGRLHEAVKANVSGDTIKDTAITAMQHFMNYVKITPNDDDKGRIFTKLADFTKKFIRVRCAGFDTSFTGDDWTNLDIEQNEESGLPLGIKLYSFDIIKYNSDIALVQARNLATIDTIKGDVANEVGNAIAAIMRPIIAAGGSAELAQQQAFGHQKPDLDPPPPPAPNVVVISDSDPRLQAMKIQGQSPNLIGNASNNEQNRDRGQKADSDDGFS